jgi:hypothetical protein
MPNPVFNAIFYTLAAVLFVVGFLIALPQTNAERGNGPTALICAGLFVWVLVPLVAAWQAVT